ncbi:cellulose synthase/poly-beta-1,6-N-acetylglucosamine synthase-like glycosyltransferase [Loktanella ponticola]|uniref:Cellulose synthase/poly-beta-1,6-N-acetylglucosamine synthase-like glycosyltransferase n=1 Tax=Yoonia ponticola TaxID=1524255 RepID=A0A7W9BMM2_9RHOB|nr:glycosyltransferase family 2 protein [Yoonia ponticola]MBB5723327.1 cellulose synthase/poly-beta-1,6-N-acetylglucosamine synthase-like glycosyltransferase [Yoonia ponticola]
MINQQAHFDEKSRVDMHDATALTIAQSQAITYRCAVINPCVRAPEAGLVDIWGAHRCLRDHILPWRRIGGAVVILTHKPELFQKHSSALALRYGPVRMAITTEQHLFRAISLGHVDDLTKRAENRVPDAVSSRTWNAKLMLIGSVLVVLGVITLFALSPVTGFVLLSFWAIITLAANTLLKAAAAIVGIFAQPQAPDISKIDDETLPIFTILIPLYKEKEIAAHLLERVKLIDYPRDRLDLCLVMEADDETTRASLGTTNLPAWIRPIAVPQGALKTKPRALNYALDFARGSLVGVYDAEDAPDPDQLRKVAQYFAKSGEKVACLQGVLDYYNAPANWLTRCFALEYAGWFRVVLPGLERLGLVVPLGGTTLFFRRNILEKLGAWDAHNVTEDADLGVRLARHGYRTELIATTTQEEANGRFWPWVKQRSRWLKGYAITYGVHMRDPQKLYRELGLRKFLGFQILFAGTLSQFVLAPVLWSFWVMPFGVHHPMNDHLQGWVLIAVVGMFVFSELTNMFVLALGVTKAKKMWLIKWIPTVHLYFPMAAIAAYKGFYELTFKPFYWDKTTHGVLLPPAPTASPARPTSDA